MLYADVQRFHAKHCVCRMSSSPTPLTVDLGWFVLVGLALSSLVLLHVHSGFRRLTFREVAVVEGIRAWVILKMEISKSCWYANKLPLGPPLEENPERWHLVYVLNISSIFIQKIQKFWGSEDKIFHQIFTNRLLKLLIIKRLLCRKFLFVILFLDDLNLDIVIFVKMCPTKSQMFYFYLSRMWLFTGNSHR